MDGTQAQVKSQLKDGSGYGEMYDENVGTGACIDALKKNDKNKIQRLFSKNPLKYLFLSKTSFLLRDKKTF